MNILDGNRTKMKIKPRENITGSLKSVGYLIGPNMDLQCLYKYKNLPYLAFITSVIRQKCESQNGSFKKTKHIKFPEKRTFLPL